MKYIVRFECKGFVSTEVEADCPIEALASVNSNVLVSEKRDSIVVSHTAGDRAEVIAADGSVAHLEPSYAEEQMDNLRDRIRFLEARLKEVGR